MNESAKVSVPLEVLEKIRAGGTGVPAEVFKILQDITASKTSVEEKTRHLWGVGSLLGERNVVATYEGVDSLDIGLTVYGNTTMPEVRRWFSPVTDKELTQLKFVNVGHDALVMLANTLYKIGVRRPDLLSAKIDTDYFNYIVKQHLQCDEILTGLFETLKEIRPSQFDDRFSQAFLEGVFKNWNNYLKDTNGEGCPLFFDTSTKTFKRRVVIPVPVQVPVQHSQPQQMVTEQHETHREFDPSHHISTGPSDEMRKLALARGKFRVRIRHAVRTSARPIFGSIRLSATTHSRCTPPFNLTPSARTFFATTREYLNRFK